MLCCGSLFLFAAFILIFVSGNSLAAFVGSLLFLATTIFMCYYSSTWGKPAEKPVPEGSAGPSGHEPSEVSALEADVRDSDRTEGVGVGAESEYHDPYETEAVRTATGASTPIRPGSFWYPESIVSTEFHRRTAYLDKGATAFRADGIGPEQMQKEAALALQRLNLYLVRNEIDSHEGQTRVGLAGWARSRTGKLHLGVEIDISGVTSVNKCFCRVFVYSDASGELQGMLTSIRTALTSVAPIGRTGAPLAAAQTPQSPISSVQIASPEVLVERQAAFSGGLLIFTVTVSNRSYYPLRDVDAFLISYPSALLRLVTDDSSSIQELEPGLRYPSQFTLSPLSDSVRGELIAAVSFLTPDGRSHTVTAEPLSIVPVRGMLEPDPIEKDEFNLRMTRFRTGETTFKTEDWTPEEMYEKSIRVLAGLGFHIVQDHTDTSEALVMAEVDGAARGKSMHKPLVVTLVIYGASHALQTSCRIISAGEDESMIFPSIEEIRSLLEAWPCPSCKAGLPPASILNLKSGGIVKCSSCGKTMDLARYRNWPQ